MNLMVCVCFNKMFLKVTQKLKKREGISPNIQSQNFFFLPTRSTKIKETENSLLMRGWFGNRLLTNGGSSVDWNSVLNGNLVTYFIILNMLFLWASNTISRGLSFRRCIKILAWKKKKYLHGIQDERIFTAELWRWRTYGSF